MTARDGRDAAGPSGASDHATDSAADSTPASADSAATATDQAVSVAGVTKRFGSGDEAVTAVDDVSFTIESGSVVGLLGPNGAGKTTLIKSILGMVVPDAGEVHVHGVDVRRNPRQAYAHVDAMLEGARNDYWRLTVRENLRYFATIGGVDPDSAAPYHDRLLERLDLREKADVPVRKLSRGMKQKVSLASALAGDASVLFLDEPTLGLDVESSRTLQRELRRLAEEEGLTVVLSSHDMDVIETVCDRVIILSGGRIVADDDVETLLTGGSAHGLAITSRDLDADLLAALRDQFTVTDADLFETDPGGSVVVTADSEAVYDLFAHLRTAGVRLDRVRSVEVDLEDVFVDLTGIDAADPAPGPRDGATADRDDRQRPRGDDRATPVHQPDGGSES
jgi:ABC-2 type transport system ATP-binding protein